jgi:hypothetical protein
VIFLAATAPEELTCKSLRSEAVADSSLVLWPTKPDVVNPAIASRLHFGYQWRGVTDPGR